MVLVLAEQQGGKFKNAAFVTTTKGVQVAKALGTQCVAIVLGPSDDPSILGEYGATKVLHYHQEELRNIDSQRYTAILGEVAQQEQARIVIVSHTSNGKLILGRLAIRLNAGFGSGVSNIEVDGNNIVITRSAFSGKAIERYTVTGEMNIVSLIPNACKASKGGSPCPVEQRSAELLPTGLKVREVKRLDGKVPLPEAEIVVSAGRGLRDPSNWGIIEALADELGAALACSRPVADSGWRPHHEHVGQTGLAIRPNLYMAIGISGAIQHLAGVNNSKVIVVINKDPEAPFFKAADYGVCGDLFEVVPRLTGALRKAGT